MQDVRHSAFGHQSKDFARLGCHICSSFVCWLLNYSERKLQCELPIGKPLFAQNIFMLILNIQNAEILKYQLSKEWHYNWNYHKLEMDKISWLSSKFHWSNLYCEGNIKVSLRCAELNRSVVCPSLLSLVLVTMKMSVLRNSLFLVLIQWTALWTKAWDSDDCLF